MLSSSAVSQGMVWLLGLAYAHYLLLIVITFFQILFQITLRSSPLTLFTDQIMICKITNLDGIFQRKFRDR